MRHDLYARLQELPMSFHSKWQSGQLLSRATTDLSAIRRFSGFGLLFLVINILQVTVVTIVLLHLYWPLGLVVALAAGPIVWLSMRFEKGYVVLSRQVQDQQGDLATRAEEGAVGIRVIKSFGRSHHVELRLRRRRPEAPRDEPVEGAVLGPVLDLPGADPQPCRRPRAAPRRHRGRPRCAHPRRAGGLHHPDAVAGVAGRLAGRDPGDGAGGDDRRGPDPRDLRHLPRHRRRSRGAAVHGGRPPALRPRRLRVPRRARPSGAARRQPRHPARRDGRPGRCDGLGQDGPDRTRPPALRRRRVGGSPSTGSTSGSSPSRSCARWSRPPSRSRRCSR